MLKFKENENQGKINQSVQGEASNEKVEVENKANNDLNKSNLEVQMKLSESSQKFKNAEELVEEQPGYIGN